MKASVEQINSVQRRIKIDCDQSDVNNEFDKAYREVRKKARIHGFRPGKAPLHMIRKMYGASVAADVADKLIRNFLFGAISEHELSPISAPVLETSELPKENEEYAFSAVIDIMPEMNVEGYKGLKLEFLAPPSIDEVVEQELKGIQRNQAKTKQLEEGISASEGHLITFNQSASKSDGSEIAQMKADDVSVELGAEQLFPELEKALLGKNKGEVAETIITMPKEYNDSDLAETEVTFKLSVTNIQELLLPPIDDDLAKDMGLEDLADLKSKIKDRAEMEVDNAKQNQLEASIFKQLADKNSFEIPPAIVDQVIDSMIEGSQQDPEAKAKAKADQEERKKLRGDAQMQARNTLMLMDVIKKEEVQVEDADVDAYLQKAFKMPGMDEPKPELLETLKKSFSDKDKENLLFKKAIDFIISQSEVTEKPRT